MAREILLRLRTKNYERAKKLAEQIVEGAKTTLKTTKALSTELKESLQRAKKAAELRKRGAALGARGARASGRDLLGGQRQAFAQRFGSVGEAREKGEAFASLLAGANDPVASLPGLISGAGQLIPGLGPFTALLAPVTEKLLGYMEERFEQELAKQEALFTARLEEERFRSDYSRRFADDPAFAKSEAKRALRETLLEEAVIGKRVQRSTADLLSDLDL